jgi:transcription-repair coupling factor (superfamily II helicase)
MRSRASVAAIKEFSDLGSGFRVAALDLEIRGAGNLLGGEQSGTSTPWAWMCMKLLEETVRGAEGGGADDDRRDDEPGRGSQDRRTIRARR